MAVPDLYANTPTAGKIAWGPFSIQYDGTSWNVPADSTSLRFVYWLYRDGDPLVTASNTQPNLGPDDLLLFINKAGVPVNVPASSVLDGSLIVDGTIVGTALIAGTVHGDRIQAGTLVVGQVSGLQTTLDGKTDQKYILSRGTDLVTNGTGYLGTNYNFSGFNVEKIDVPDGASASLYFKQTYASSAQIDELIPFDPSKDYRFSFKLRQTVAGATTRAYGFLSPYDQFGNNIQPSCYMFQPGTTTTLAAPLNPGDTTITLTSAANWYGQTGKPAGTNTHFRSIIFWNWTDPNGKVWPEHTYSRNQWTSDLWADGGVDLATKKITLRAPWAGPAYAAGHPLSNGSSGGSFMYMPSLQNGVIPEAWTTYSDVFSAGIMAPATAASGRGGASWATGVPPGTANVKVGWLLNYAPSPANSIVGRHAVAGVSFSDASAAQAAADTVQATVTGWTKTGQTTIDGGKIAADSILAAQIGAGQITALKIAADAITAVKIQAGAVVADKIATDAVTAVKIQADAVVAGKIATDAVTAREIAADTITANEIAADTITANEIAADTITSKEIAAGAITATELDAEVLRAGFVLTGKLQVGSHTWTPEDGLIIPQPNGGRIHLPADGVTPARLDGHANLRSATVEKDLNVMGATNKVSGLLNLANGITEPIIPASAYYSWPSVYSQPLDHGTAGWRMTSGLCAHHSDGASMVTALNFGSGSLRKVNRTTGEWGGDFYNMPDYLPWGGVGFASGHYYVYGQDLAPGRDGWWVRKIVATTGVLAAEYQISTNDFEHDGRMPAITADAGTGKVYISYMGTNTTISNLITMDLNLTPASFSNVTLGDWGSVQNFGSIAVATADFGTPVLLVGTDESKSVNVYALPSLTFMGAHAFKAANSIGIRGIIFDSTSNRLKSYDRNGILSTYSSWATAQPITASYTWYDGAGTVRETREGPTTSFTLPARSHLNIETPPPPDSGNTDALQVDKANRVGIYVGVGAGSRRLQSYLGVDGSGISARRLTMDTIATGTATAPASNTFVGGATSPGKVSSFASDGDGALFTVDGAGNGRWKKYDDKIAALKKTWSTATTLTFAANTRSTGVVYTFPAGTFTSPPTVVAVAGDARFTAGVHSITKDQFTIDSYFEGTTVGAVAYPVVMQIIAFGT